MDYAQLITVLTQLGLAGAAWRLANKIDQRLNAHEVLDLKFHDETTVHLTKQDAALATLLAR